MRKESTRTPSELACSYGDGPRTLWCSRAGLTHCNVAAAFVGEVGYTELTAHPEALDQLRLDLRMSGWHDASQL
ncbi:CbrC family protein [Streptomyces sp. NPDC001393]